jgi:superfamily I DNA and/or RNA helicase
MLNDLEFSLVLADEATQAQEHAVLIPLARMAKAGHSGNIRYV